MESERPKVGTGVIVLKEGKVLLGRRRSGEFSLPGGHLEHNESFEDCAARETKEEAGIEVANIRFFAVINLNNDGKHYVTIGLLADWKVGEPRTLPEESIGEWAWYDVSDLPVQLFAPSKVLLECYQNGTCSLDLTR